MVTCASIKNPLAVCSITNVYYNVRSYSLGYQGAMNSNSTGDDCFDCLYAYTAQLFLNGFLDFWYRRGNCDSMTDNRVSLIKLTLQKRTVFVNIHHSHK